MARTWASKVVVPGPSQGRSRGVAEGKVAMGLFDRLKRRGAQGASGRSSVPAEVAPGTVCAPVSGRVVPMASVPDPVFSGETLDKGCTIWPDDGTVFSPISGTVSAVMGHAVGVSSPDGVELLVHVGIDTVDMQGKGFTPLAQEGDAVRAGDALLAFDRDAIAAASHPDIVVLAIPETGPFKDVTMAVTADSTVSAGQTVLLLA